MVAECGTICVVQDRGLIPRVFQELFAQTKKKQMQQVGMLAITALGCIVGYKVCKSRIYRFLACCLHTSIGICWEM